MGTKQINADFPAKLQFLFRPYRYKVARGGRGSGKSWSFARALLLLGLKKPLRVLCAREIQTSIKQSVHKLLEDQIDLLGLQGHYSVLDTEIRGTNGTEFAFTGLSTLTVDTIKSYEGCDICWIEEGQAISKRSWDILIPTIRKAGSEIWITYNPDLESDETHQRFTVNQPDNCVNQVVNWRDNPWFNDVLEQERKFCKEHNPDDYDNIWEGHCRPAIDGAIYYKQVQEAELQGRICNLPYDPMCKVHVIMDLGWSDLMSIGFVQRHLSELRIIDYIEGHQRTLDDYSQEMASKGYNWGRVWLPHDGFTKGHKYGQSTYDILKLLGWDCVEKEEIAQQSVEEGIRVTRMKFPRMYFDEQSTKPLIESLRRYRRHINRQTEAAGSPVHDDASHGADMLRYMAINEQNMINENLAPTGNYIPGMVRGRPGGSAWMGM